MTDKEKRIKEMAKIACYVCEFGHAFNGECDLGHDDPCSIALEASERMYETVYRKQSGWISVDEMLPETYEDVLCFDRRSVIIDFMCSDGTWCGVHDKPITHWMPLPEPPRMKEGESDDRN